ncbi:TPA: hypothetical protein ACKULS_002199, partial [Neisseria gonorrhoeae]
FARMQPDSGNADGFRQSSLQHKPLPYQWGKFRNNTIKPEKQAMFFNSICQCIRFQHVSRMKMYGGLTKIRTRRRAAGSTDSTKRRGNAVLV